jgi:hypothetical protein
MGSDIKDPASMTRASGVKRFVGAWLFVTWMIVVCASYAYFMLRSLF